MKSNSILLPIVRHSMLATSLAVMLLSISVDQARSAPPAPAPAAGPSSAPAASRPSDLSRLRHADFLQVLRRGGENIRIVFLGDSIMDGWSFKGRAVWDKTFEPLRPANFAVSGDTSQNVLWRLQNGELEGCKLALVVLLVGTNDLASQSDAQIVASQQAILKEIKDRQPQAKILLLGIFPRGATPADPLRARIKRINAGLAGLADGERIAFLDLGDKFLAPDGTISTDVMFDYLHPSAKGYEIWADAMLPTVMDLVKP